MLWFFVSMVGMVGFASEFLLVVYFVGAVAWCGWAVGLIFVGF